MSKNKQEVFFGFKKIASEAKSGLVEQVFSNVASKYDLMNDFMSAGMHRLWKDELVKNITAKDDDQILDMAGGTGDIAFRIAKKYQRYNRNFSLIIADYNQAMLDEGKKRAIDKNFLDLKWQKENGEKTSFKDASFDYYTIAYGIRNFTNLDAGVSEAYRVLKSGGKFLCLEFNQLENDLLKKIYDFYSFNIIPKVGELVTGDKESYQYFVESIRMFPDSGNFKNMLENAGFKNVSFKKLTFGITTLYIAEKP